MPARDAVLKILREQYNLADKPLSDEQTLEDLGIDSLDQVELVMEVEGTMKISIPDEEFEAHYRTLTLGQFLEIVNKHTPAD